MQKKSILLLLLCRELAFCHPLALQHCETLFSVLALHMGLRQRETRFNPYLESPAYAPVEGNLFIPHLKVEGKLPQDLQGMFARTGPNPNHAPIDKAHWFDGDGMIHSVLIRDGKAEYRRAFVETDSFKREKKAGRQLNTGLIQPLTLDNLWGFMRSGRVLPTKANTALVHHNGKLLATHYTAGEPYELNPATLETVGSYRFPNQPLMGIVPHTKIDPRTGELLFLNASLLSPEIHHVTVSPTGEVTEKEMVRLRGPIIMHDFAITEHYSLILDLPLKAAQATQDIRHVAADPELPGRIGVFDRRSKDVRWFETDPAMILHVVNAHETENGASLIAARLQDNTFGAHLMRWDLDFKTGKTTETKMSDRPFEFPRINDAYAGIQNRHAYLPLLAKADTFAFEGISKYDLKSNTKQDYLFGKGRFGSEPVFVKKEGATREDEGYLLTFVTDTNHHTGELIVLDAENYTELAKVKIPVRLPTGFHSTYLPLPKK